MDWLFLRTLAIQRSEVSVDQRVHGTQLEVGKKELVTFLTVDVRGVRTVAQSDSSALVYSQPHIAVTLCFLFPTHTSVLSHGFGEVGTGAW